VAFSPNGKWFASASDDGTVTLWDAVTWKRQRTLGTFVGKDTVARIPSITFSSDSKTLAAAVAKPPGEMLPREVRVWAVPSGREKPPLKNLGASVFAVCFSPRNRSLLAVGTGVPPPPPKKFRKDDQIAGGLFPPEAGEAILWDVNKGKRTHLLSGHGSVVYSLAFAPNGKTLASASLDKTVKLWNVTNGKLLRTWKGHTKSVNAVCFSPDGKTVASAGDDGTVQLWQANSGRLQKTFAGQRNWWVQAVAFSPDSKTLASVQTNLGRRAQTVQSTVKLWDVEKGKLKSTLRVNRRIFFCIAFAPKRDILAAGAAYSEGKRLVGEIRLWSLGARK
jgi:WD40 repeat protein